MTPWHWEGPFSCAPVPRCLGGDTSSHREMLVSPRAVAWEAVLHATEMGWYPRSLGAWRRHREGAGIPEPRCLEGATLSCHREALVPPGWSGCGRRPLRRDLGVAGVYLPRPAHGGLQRGRGRLEGCRLEEAGGCVRPKDGRACAGGPAEARRNGKHNNRCINRIQNASRGSRGSCDFLICEIRGHVATKRRDSGWARFGRQTDAFHSRRMVYAYVGLSSPGFCSQVRAVWNEFD